MLYNIIISKLVSNQGKLYTGTVHVCVTSVFVHSKNQCGAVGLAAVIKSLAYSPSIEELLLTDLSRVTTTTSHLSEALEKLFLLTVSLKKVI